MSINTFKDIVAWQKAHLFTLEIYKITKTFPRIEDYNLTSQMRRCAVSVPSNIAEGFARKSLSDSKRFYIIAEGSLEELKYQLLLSKDLNYTKESIYNKLNNQAEEVSKLLSSWKRSQKY